MSSSASISSIAYNKLNDIIINIETQIKYIYFTLALVNKNSYELPYYQHFINILFVFIVILVGFVIYRDYIFKRADMRSRCSDIQDTLEINNALDEPFKYNIYIVSKQNTDKILTNYSIRMRYDFVNEKTFIDFGKKDNISEILFTETVSNDYKNNDSSVLSSGFSYFDLDELQQKFIQYIDGDNKIYFIDKARVTSDNYLYVITREDNKKVLNDQSAIKLLNFIKSYGYDNSKSLSPIYNLLYAVDNKKNNVVI
jgi:hypothetical protein